MTIEFNTPYGKVPEKLISDIRNEIIQLSHFNKKISRAEVVLKEEEAFLAAANKICEIRFAIYGDDLLVHARTQNFRNSAKEVITELKRLIRKQVKKQKELPDLMTFRKQGRTFVSSYSITNRALSAG